MKRTVVFLLLPFLCIGFTTLNHKFSSTVHQCDDFEEFVCNEDENEGLSPLFDSLRNGFYDRIKEEFLKDNDMIVEQFKKIYDGPNVTFHVDFPYNPRISTRHLKLTYHDKITNVTKEINTTGIHNYLNHLYLKYALQHELIPNFRRLRDLYFGIINEIREMTTTNIDVIGYEGSRSFWKHIRGHYLAGVEEDGLRLEKYSRFVQEAFNEILVKNARKDTLRLIFPYEGRKIVEIDMLNRSFFNIDSGGLMLPVSYLYKPKSEDGTLVEILRYYDILYRLYVMGFQVLYNNDKFFQHIEKWESAKCFKEIGMPLRHMAYVSAMRRAAKMIRRPNGDNTIFNGTRFNAEQWFFIAVQSRACAHSAKDKLHATDVNLQEIFKQNRFFQEAFQCRPGHKLYTHLDNMCKIFCVFTDANPRKVAKGYRENLCGNGYLTVRFLLEEEPPFR
ncbi:hypothetical protein QR680_014541 [Steinernema hermaphroditum]|uniref:Peptidase M13 C-terminal domain-containing protein n=1 Tax=Steinernema hermaphroditum TaxID=289476 RepID=A0AA39M431_9BILA|nr:hypothetical protein QR680_014541 [Steinernema hermaphroditum]